MRKPFFKTTQRNCLIFQSIMLHMAYSFSKPHMYILTLLLTYKCYCLVQNYCPPKICELISFKTEKKACIISIYCFFLKFILFYPISSLKFQTWNLIYRMHVQNGQCHSIFINNAKGLIFNSIEIHLPFCFFSLDKSN